MEIGDSGTESETRLLFPFFRSVAVLSRDICALRLAVYFLDVVFSLKFFSQMNNTQERADEYSFQSRALIDSDSGST
jgi:hypothetical protein